MLGVLSQAFERVLEDVDAVAGGKLEVEAVRALQEVDGEVEHVLLGKRKVVAEDGHLVLAAGEPERHGGLQSGEDVVGHLVGGLVVVHGDATPEVRMRGDGGSGDDRFDIASVVQKRREGCPALLAHPVAFVEKADAAGDHRGDERRGVVCDGSGLGQDGRDEEILGTGVAGTLIDVEILASLPGGGHGQGGFADSGGADEPGRQRQIGLVDHEPAGKQLPQGVGLPDPLLRGRHGISKVKGDVLDLNGPALRG